MRSSITIDIVRRKDVLKNEMKFKVLKAIKKNSLIETNLAARILMDREPDKTSKVRRRCTVTGRDKGNYRRFKICRIKVREDALMGNLACVRKLTWLSRLIQKTIKYQK